MPCCIECIQTAEVGIVERCGKYYMLITQYFDMLNSIGTRPDTLTVFIDEDGE